MRLNYIWMVAYKEILSTWRDRRTLRSTILMPLLMIPIFTIGMPLLFGSTIGGQQEARQKVGIAGTAPDALRTALTTDQKGPDGTVLRAGVDLVPVDDPMRAVRDGDVDAALVLPAELPGDGKLTSARVRLVSKLSNQRVQAGAAAKVRDALRAYNDSLVSARLAQMDLDTSFLTPIEVETVDASSEEEQRSGALAFIIPYFLLQFILSGAMSTAIDSTAGEKERGTMEVLLVSPVRRLEVVLGKLTATTIFAMLTAVFGVIGFALAGPLSRLVNTGETSAEAARVFGGTLSVDATGIVTLLLLAVSSALVLSAALIAVSVFARSFREAQTYLAPVFLLLIVPMFVLQFADFISKSLWLYAVPLVGGALGILDVVKGAPVIEGAGVAILGNLVAAAALTMLGLRSFRNEAVLFRN